MLTAATLGRPEPADGPPGFLQGALRLAHCPPGLGDPAVGLVELGFQGLDVIPGVPLGLGCLVGRLAGPGQLPFRLGDGPLTLLGGPRPLRRPGFLNGPGFLRRPGRLRGLGCFRLFGCPRLLWRPPAGRAPRAALPFSPASLTPAAPGALSPAPRSAGAFPGDAVAPVTSAGGGTRLSPGVPVLKSARWTARGRVPAASSRATCGSARAAPNVAVRSSRNAAEGDRSPACCSVRRISVSTSLRRARDSSRIFAPSSAAAAARSSSPSALSCSATPGSARTSWLIIQAGRVGLRSPAISLAAGRSPAARAWATRAVRRSVNSSGSEP